MIEAQYDMIMELHGNWLDSSIEAAGKQIVSKIGPGSLSSFEFTSFVRNRTDMPDGIRSMSPHDLISLVEMRLEILAGIGRAKRIKTRQGWMTYEVLEILDALAAL